MLDAVVGYTGFVGSNVLPEHAEVACFNSKNFCEMHGREFRRIICAGASAAKWIANREPSEDLSKIRQLTEVLSTVSCEQLVLISTIDVYSKPIGVDESQTSDSGDLHPYGRNRLYLESFIQDRFHRHAVIRLPALFGPGLKKNALYDLIHDNNIDNLDSQAQFQWYDIRWLRDHIELVVEAGIPLVNLCTPPIILAEIGQRFFPEVVIPQHSNKASAHYDLRTIHSSTFGGPQGYICDKATVLNAMANYVTGL